MAPTAEVANPCVFLTQECVGVGEAWEVLPDMVIYLPPQCTLKDVDDDSSWKPDIRMPHMARRIERQLLQPSTTTTGGNSCPLFLLEGWEDVQLWDQAACY